LHFFFHHTSVLQNNNLAERSIIIMAVNRRVPNLRVGLLTLPLAIPAILWNMNQGNTTTSVQTPNNSSNASITTSSTTHVVYSHTLPIIETSIAHPLFNNDANPFECVPIPALTVTKTIETIKTFSTASVSIETHLPSRDTGSTTMTPAEVYAALLLDFDTEKVLWSFAPPTLIHAINMDTSGAPKWIQIVTHILWQLWYIFGLYCFLNGLWRGFKWLLCKISGAPQMVTMTRAEMLQLQSELRDEREKLDLEWLKLRVQRGIHVANAALINTALNDYTTADEAVMHASGDIYIAAESFKDWLRRNSHVKPERLSQLSVLMNQMVDIVRAAEAKIAAREALRLELTPITVSGEAELQHDQEQTQGTSPAQFRRLRITRDIKPPVTSSNKVAENTTAAPAKARDAAIVKSQPVTVYEHLPVPAEGSPFSNDYASTDDSSDKTPRTPRKQQADPMTDSLYGVSPDHTARAKNSTAPGRMSETAPPSLRPRSNGALPSQQQTVSMTPFTTTHSPLQLQYLSSPRDKGYDEI
jgi:hypothetical protein